MKNNLSIASTNTSVSLAQNFERRREPASYWDSKAQALVQAYRLMGYRQACVDPLGLNEAILIPELEPGYYGFDIRDRRANYFTDLMGVEGTGIADLLQRLQTTYSGPIGLDCEHLRDSSRRNWLWQRMESNANAVSPAPHERLQTLKRLAAAEALEHYLDENYGHHKRFSLEGCESLIPLLDRLIRRAGSHKVDDIVLGMAHRGRLNVLVNLLGMPLQQLRSVLDGAPVPGIWDLKYHLGYSSIAQTEHGPVNLFLAHNPSHLESVIPVVCGMARALQDGRKDSSSERVAPVLIHGDGAFAGQGVVMETLNLSQTRGYGNGGTVHIVVNNQIGFTTSDPRDTRSGRYCTDVAKMIDAPILRVNADHPDSVILAAEWAFDYRMEFGSDIVVDLVGFRRLGHNEQDVPELTQPWMQRRVSAHPGVVSRYADQLVRSGHASGEDIKQIRSQHPPALLAECERTASVPATQVGQRSEPRNAPIDTVVTLSRLQSMVQAMTRVPHGFTAHAEVQNLIQGWRAAVHDSRNPADWTLAENLAYATLLASGFNIRLSGMDVGRGTFFHRHAVWHDQQRNKRDEETYIPLRHLSATQGTFDVFDSPLSEEAVLGFEYGYSVKKSHGLVIWEAQYGDFVNNAQVMIDQYISTGESKWGYRSDLVVLLPHGHEGVGPEHSSAYLGRFLQLCAEQNMRVAAPTTSAQFFHLLRRQAIAAERKPLIVMTPKSCLYAKAESHSRLAEFTQGEFQPVIADEDAIDPLCVHRVILCSGKVYFDIAAKRRIRNRRDIAVVRLEELYPFPHAAVADELRKFPNLRDVAWAQEEAKNHGAWHFVRDDLEASLPANTHLTYAGRPAAAPSAVCYLEQHLKEQRAVVAAALGFDCDMDHHDLHGGFSHISARTETNGLPMQEVEHPASSEQVW